MLCTDCVVCTHNTLTSSWQSWSTLIWLLWCLRVWDDDDDDGGGDGGGISPCEHYPWQLTTDWLPLADCTTLQSGFSAPLITDYRQCWSGGGRRVEVPSSITWRHNTRDSRWQTSDLTFNLLDCGRNLWSRRLVMLYNGPVAVVDPGNKISRYPLFQSSPVQPHSRSYLRRPTPSSGISGMSCFSSLEYNRNYRGHLGSLWSNY